MASRMALHPEPVTPGNVELLIGYCREHGAEHDSSYLPGPGFAVTPEQPSYLLLSGDAVVGAASLMLTPRYARQGVGRFAILHSTLPAAEAYAMLLAALQPHTAGLRKLYLFLPDTRTQTAGFLQGLKFAIERYSFVLDRHSISSAPVAWPEGVRVEALLPGDPAGAQQFADCINDSFARLAGHSPMSGEDMRRWFTDEGYLEGGICLLRENDRPIGTVAVMADTDDPAQADISALGIVPAWQGRGLGRRLLRFAVDLASRRGFLSAGLSVNAENESALRLYLDEGFKVTGTMVCYARHGPPEVCAAAPAAPS